MNSGSWYWPDVSDMDGAKGAIRYGMWCALLVAGVTALFVVLSFMGIRLMGTTPAALLDALLFAVIGYGLSRFSRFAAVAGFGLFLIEKSTPWLSRVAFLASVSWVLLYSSAFSTVSVAPSLATSCSPKLLHKLTHPLRCLVPRSFLEDRIPGRRPRKAIRGATCAELSHPKVTVPRDTLFAQM